MRSFSMTCITYWQCSRRFCCTVWLCTFHYRYGVRGSKVTRHISFTERLDLRPYMSATKSVSVSYRLYAVLVHNGCTTNSGHYYCYVQSPGGTWHCMNDSSVSNSCVSVMKYYAFLKKFVSLSCLFLSAFTF